MNAIVLSSIADALSAGISIHTVIYLALLIIIIYLAMQKSYRPEEPVVLSERVCQLLLLLVVGILC
jgi:hypothetical protein